VTRRDVLIDGELPPPGETERFVDVSKSDPDRYFLVTLHNGGRTRQGTMGLWRWRWTLEAIKRRHPGATLSPKHERPTTVRSRKAGPIIVTCTPLEGPVRRLMN
jgi:hypothetical protein